MNRNMNRALSRPVMLLSFGAVVALVVIWAVFRPELLFVDETVNEDLPVVRTAAGATAPELRGAFHGVAHETRGEAAIHRLEDGRRVLRLTSFETSNGPDVRVLLVAATDATDNETVTDAGSIELGKLKGNIGDQNYDVPADVDLGLYRAVTIWCNRFGVNFGTAPLMAGGERQLRSVGPFHGVAHETTGTASIYELEDGRRVLRLTGFTTSNGPDVRVLLVAAPDATDNDTITDAGSIELGKLKGNVGDQNYDVPADVDLGTYRAVTIWCNRFGVNFGTAPLRVPGAARS